MRVFINAASAVAGGGVTYLQQLLTFLPTLAPDDFFLFAVPAGLVGSAITAPADPRPFLELPAGARNVRLLPIAETGRGALQGWLWENTTMLEICRNERIDLLFCPANIIPLRRPGLPLVVMLQNIAPFYPRVRRWLGRFEGWKAALRMLILEFLSIRAVRQADYVLFLSEASRKVVEEREGPVRGAVIPHGRSGLFRPGKERPPTAPSRDYFLFVSNFYVYKGLEILVDALAADPGLPPVVVIGQSFNHGYLDWIRGKIRAKGLEKRLIFPGYVPNEQLPAWYGNALALVFPSWCESFGMTPLEAMSCGCPVVALRAGPVPEVCGEAAWYAEAPDGESLADAMRQALSLGNEPTIRAQAVSRAARFSWTETMQRHLEAFREALPAR